MGWTKRQLVQKAYEKINLADYFFDLTPEQLISACDDLDAMMASWGAIYIRLGYNLADTPNSSNIDSDSGVPVWANQAIYLKLAVQVAFSIGKTPSPELQSEAQKTYLRMLNASMPPVNEYQFPQSLPRGAGQKYWRGYVNPFFPTPDNPVDAGPDRPLLEQ